MSKPDGGPAMYVLGTREAQLLEGYRKRRQPKRRGMELLSPDEARRANRGRLVRDGDVWIVRPA